MSRILVRGMYGMGDNVYQRPAIRFLLERGHHVYLQTAWPELWYDFNSNLSLVAPETDLRTQSLNAARFTGWVPPRRIQETLSLHYNISDFNAGLNPMRAIGQRVKMTGSIDFSFKPRVTSRLIDGPYAIVHPGTVRREWTNSARPCKSEYLQAVVDAHPDLKWVEVGHLESGEEDLYGEPLQNVDHSFMHGELNTDELYALMWNAVGIVSCVGFMLPLGIAMRKPTVIVYGGDVPDHFLVDEEMNLYRYRAVQPSPFCACYADRHYEGECNKTLDPVDVLNAFEEVVSL